MCAFTVFFIPLLQNGGNTVKRLAFFLILPLVLCGCSKKIGTRRFFALDTQISITAEKALCDSAADMCKKYEKIFSRTDPDSELYRINNFGETNLSADIKAVLEFSSEMYALSSGAFDCSIGALSDLWNVKERTVPPTEGEIQAARARCGFDKVSLSPFSAGGTVLDFGACAKGYIADRIAENFRTGGAKKAVIDLGGNVYSIGSCIVGIRNPNAPDELCGRFTLTDKSAVTSGAYQRFFEYDNVRYHHILNPATGHCASSGLCSVTVISPSSLTADCLSTAIFVMGEGGISLCEAFPDTDALLITNDGRFVTTDGFYEKYAFETID